MTSGDGTKSGYDEDGIWYLSDAIQLYLQRVEKEQRTGVFWAGGATTEEDFAIVDEFAEINLNNKGRSANTVFSYADFERMNLDGNNKNNLWWRAVNRMSKALAAGATNGVAYVYLKNNNCRTLFSPSSQNPQDSDPTANGQATNGEIFSYAELPMLMRNMNIQQIKTFSKVNRKFVVNSEWDVNVDLDKPRDFLPDIAMDATPIVLPQAAGRPPLKRDILSRVSTTAPTSSHRKITPYSSSGFTRKLSTGTGLSSISMSTASWSNRTIFASSVGHSITASWRSSSTASGTSVNSPESSVNTHNISVTSLSSVFESIARSGPTVHGGRKGRARLSSKIGTMQSPGNTSISSLTTLRVSPSSPPSVSASRTASTGTVVEGTQPKTDFTATTNNAGSSLMTRTSLSVTSSTNLNPTGAVARSSALALQSQIIAIAALLATLPMALAFSAAIGPGLIPKPCGVSADPDTDIFNAATCLTKSINVAISDIKPVTSDLSDLNALQIPLENDNEDGNEPSQSQAPQNPLSTRLSTTSASSSGSRDQSCSDFRTVSDCRVSCPSSASCSTTCSSTSIGCGATGTTSTVSNSAAACAFNPVSDVPSQTIPLAAFIATAWWDYGISCAGPCTDFTLPPSSISSIGDFSLSLASSSSSYLATIGASMTSNPTIPTVTSVHLVLRHIRTM
ncbi:hypothetical protein BDR22DRAFT_889161 [Usnea florida]